MRLGGLRVVHGETVDTEFAEVVRSFVLPFIPHDMRKGVYFASASIAAGQNERNQLLRRREQATGPIEREPDWLGSADA